MLAKKIKIKSVTVSLVGSEGTNDFVITVNPEQYDFLVNLRNISKNSHKEKGHSAYLDFKFEHEIEVLVESYNMTPDT